MQAERKKYLKHWLTAALCLELFPTASVDEVRKLAHLALDALDGLQRQKDSTAVELYQEAFFDKSVTRALSESKALQNTPPEWTETVLQRFLDYGPLTYVQDSLYWMQNLYHQVHIKSVNTPSWSEPAERMLEMIQAARRNGIHAGEMEELKQRMYNEWAALRR